MPRLRFAVTTGLLALLCTGALAADPDEADRPDPLRCPLEPGRSSLEIRVGDRVREAEIEVGPRAGQSGPAPVVFVWHGWGGKPVQLLGLAGAWPEAVFVAPRGLPRRFPGAGARRLPGWQIAEGEHDDRDLDLFDALVRDLSERECLDAGRFVSSGFSNGGYFSNLLGCRRSSVLAAIAPVGGGGPYEEACDGSVAVWIAHGNFDRIVPVREGRDTFALWQKQNACQAPERRAEGCVRAPACDRSAVLCTFPGGHFWPSALTRDWKQFLQAQRLPGSSPPAEPAANEKPVAP